MSGEPANNLPTEPTDTPLSEPEAPESGSPPEPKTPEGGDAGVDDKGKPESDDDTPESRANKRIRQLTAENRALREYSEFWRGRASGGEEKPKGGEPEPEAKAPKLADFQGDTEKWSEAYAEYLEKRAEERAARLVESRLSQAKERDAQAKVKGSWQDRLSKFASEKEDAMDVISDPSFTQTETMSQVIMASERGPELAYHLATHRAENERIKQLPPAMQAAELGRLEAKLGGQPKPPRNRGSRAPEPPNPVSGGGSPGINLETCSMEEFLAHRLGKSK